MIPKSVQKHLDKLEVKAEAVAHKVVYTAYDLAQTTGLKVEGIAKNLLVKVEPYYGAAKSKYVIVVVPASHQLDFKKLAKALKVKKVSIPSETIMKNLYKIKPGAMTAFGAIHKNTPVIVDKQMLKAKKILTRSGSFTESLFLSAKDFVKAAQAEVHTFAVKTKAPRKVITKAIKSSAKRVAKKVKNKAAKRKAKR